MFNIALYQPDIPQNTGAIIRLCSCFNATLEIIEPCGFQFHDKRLKRVAMDYLDKSKIIIHESYEKFLITKKKTSMGNHVSHSNIHKKRRFIPNLHKRRFWIESKNKHITICELNSEIK